MAIAPLVLFLAVTAIIVAVFAIVARSTASPAQADYARVGRLRSMFFLSLTTVLGILLVLTLPRLPYPAEAAAPDYVVNVVGKQYAFSLTTAPGPQTLDTWDRDFAPDVRVPVNRLIEFRVRTLDVNHGFSIYDQTGHLMAQTQAMPGYVNRLRVRFDQPGTYRVLCLEYCGMSHHAMRGVIEVGGEVTP